MGKQINMSHCKIIVFSEELAYQGISDEIYTLINDTQIRPSANIMISKCSAKYYLKQTKPELESSIFKYYEILTNSSKYTGYIPDSSIGNFFNNLLCKSCMPTAILCGTNQADLQNSSAKDAEKNSSIKANETLLEGKNGSESIGTAVFRDDKLVGELNAIETISFLTTRNEIDRFLISVPDPIKQGKYLDIYLSLDGKPEIKVDTSTSSPYIKFKTKFSGRIYSMSKDSDYLSPEVLNIISNTCNSYLESTFSKYLYRTAQEFHSDISGFGKNALLNFFTYSESNSYNWLENYKNSFFDVDVDTSIQSGMLLTET